MPREPRLKLQVPVRVFGMSKAGRPFVENAVTENVSRNGACLAAFPHEVKKYEILTLSHRDRKGRFRVVCCREQQGSRPKFQVGLRALESAQSIWSVDFSRATDECGPVERRVGQRLICGGVASIWRPGDKHFVRGTVADLSLTGCYVEMMMPLAVHDRVVLILKIRDSEIRTAADVRTAHPGMGMGLKFRDMAQTDRSCLQALLSRFGYSGSDQVDVRTDGATRKGLVDILEAKDDSSTRAGQTAGRVIRRKHDAAAGNFKGGHPIFTNRSGILLGSA